MDIKKNCNEARILSFSGTYPNFYFIYCNSSQSPCAVRVGFVIMSNATVNEFLKVEMNDTELYSTPKK